MRLFAKTSLCLLALAITACGQDDEELAPDSPGAAADASSGDGADGLADAGPEAGTTRGDPASFPAACVDDCAAACAKVEQCGGATSSWPISQKSCIDRCGIALKGPLWDDVSGNFRCCAAQDSCGAVSTCGGWLAESSAAASCEQLCSCFFGGATVPPPPSGASAPRGYAFATDVVAFEGEVPGALARRPGVEIAASGRRSAILAALPLGAAELTAHLGGRRTLPAFRDGAGRLAIAPGGIALRAANATALAEARRVLASAGLASPARLAYGEGLHWVEPGEDAWASLRALERLVAIPGVRAELDMLRSYAKLEHVPNDPRFGEQWHLKNVGANGALAGVDGRVAEAWDVTRGSADVVIGINDDGVDVGHADLSASCLPPLDFPSDWESRLGGVSGFGEHGTSVAGVAAAIGDNGEGGAGVCPGCKILPHLLGETVGVSFNITDKDIADGFQKLVDGGAWIINNSWGPGQGDPRFSHTTFPGGSASALVTGAFDYAETKGRGGKGTVIVFASGNENALVSAYAAYPTNVAVAAVDDQGLKAYYSNFGAEIAVAAPSNGGLLGITTTAAGPKGTSPYTDGFGGTSSASPFVAGVFGLVLSANPDLTAAEARAIVKATARKIDPVFGKWDANGHSTAYGYGLVDAFRAVSVAKGTCAAAADCVAPSDDCGASCGTKTACDACRTSAECAPGHVCQAVPPLGATVCVAAAVDAGADAGVEAGPEAGADAGATCPADTTLANGYCVPSRRACGACAGAEVCDGRDEDCNGSTDDGLSSCGAQSCLFRGEGCESGEVCAATYCAKACNSDADCTEGAQCARIKDRYGNVSAKKGCGSSTGNTCRVGCEVLASSLPDDELAGFVACMEDGTVDCGSVQGCALRLPVKFASK